MFYIKVRESLVVTNYGFILGLVIGFMVDQAIGTDDGMYVSYKFCALFVLMSGLNYMIYIGFREFLTVDGFKYTFNSLIGGNFLRYIVTVFLDLYYQQSIAGCIKSTID